MKRIKWQLGDMLTPDTPHMIMIPLSTSHKGKSQQLFVTYALFDNARMYYRIVKFCELDNVIQLYWKNVSR